MFGIIRHAWLFVRFFPPGWEARLYGRKDARRYSRAGTTPRPAHRVEGGATGGNAAVRAEGVIGKERDCVRSSSRRINGVATSYFADVAELMLAMAVAA